MMDSAETRAGGWGAFSDLFYFVTKNMDIEIDADKRAVILENRGLEMADVAKVFAGPHLTFEDIPYEYGEMRFITIGYMDGCMVVKAWMPRQSAYRIISLRNANARDRKKYQSRLDE